MDPYQRRSGRNRLFLKRADYPLLRAKGHQVRLVAPTAALFAGLSILLPGKAMADPTLFVNGGWGFFMGSDHVFELSQWARAPILDRLFWFDRDNQVWIGASEGWYLGSGSRTHYFELQMGLDNTESFPPFGISFGPSFNRHQSLHFRGSIWVSLGLATVSAGFEQDPDKGEYIPFAGLILKFPFYTDARFYRNSIEAGRVGCNP